jgi:two-component system sensor histidine kinase BarA
VGLLQEYSALAANRIPIEKTEFPLRLTLEAVVAEFAFKARSKGLQLSAKIDDSLPETVIGDALRLGQLVGHLIAKRSKFTQRGEVEVSAGVGATGDSGRRLIIRIRDTGVGIPAEQLANILEASASWKPV